MVCWARVSGFSTGPAEKLTCDASTNCKCSARRGSLNRYHHHGADSHGKKPGQGLTMDTKRDQRNDAWPMCPRHRSPSAPHTRSPLLCRHRDTGPPATTQNTPHYLSYYPLMYHPSATYDNI